MCAASQNDSHILLVHIEATGSAAIYAAQAKLSEVQKSEVSKDERAVKALSGISKKTAMS